jgi:hypothetical protein
MDLATLLQLQDKDIVAEAAVDEVRELRREKHLLQIQVCLPARSQTLSSEPLKKNMHAYLREQVYFQSLRLGEVVTHACNNARAHVLMHMGDWTFDAVRGT